MSGEIAELQPSYGRGTAEKEPREGHKYSGDTAERRECADTLSADPRAREKETPPGGCGRPENGSTRTSVEARHSLARDWDTLPVWAEANRAGRRPHCSEATLVARDGQGASAPLGRRNLAADRGTCHDRQHAHLPRRRELFRLTLAENYSLFLCAPPPPSRTGASRAPQSARRPARSPATGSRRRRAGPAGHVEERSRKGRGKVEGGSREGRGRV